MKKIIFYTTVFILLICNYAHAASVFVEQEQKNGLVYVTVRLDTKAESINAISGTISFDTEYLGNPSIHTEKSIINNWIDAPRLEAIHATSIQSASWAGIIPGGFDGVRSPFYEGVKSGELFQIVFTPLKLGQTTITIKGIDLKAHDGFATTIPVSNTSFDIDITQTSATVDTIKPISSNNLHALAAHDPNIFNDRWFVAFDNAVDAPSIDHYEILETQASSLSLLINPEWKKVTSPAVLSDQTRGSFIYIKAVGRDGSVAYTTIEPEIHTSTIKEKIMYAILVLVLVGLIFLFNLFKKKNKK